MSPEVPSSSSGSQNPVDVLKSNGKSFAFASRFLPGSCRTNCATLYAFCRRVDDIADGDTDPEQARNALLKIKEDLTSQCTDDPHVAAFLRLADQTGLPIDPAIELIRGVEGDLQTVRVQNEAELIRYGYRVAGSVGLMMAHLLGATDRKAPAHAIDLGIAMQLTNIARDVAEDAANGRRYLPASHVGDLEPSRILNPVGNEKIRIKKAVSYVLGLAENYYQSGIAGLRYLPERSAGSIYVAAHLYRAIGHRIREADADVWSTRHHVSLKAKVGITASILPSFLLDRHRALPEHDSRLHGYIADLPGSDKSSPLVAA